MAIGNVLRDLCDIQRESNASQAYGSKRTPAAHLSDVPCLLSEKVRKAVDPITAQLVEVADFSLMVQQGTDVLVGDRVTSMRRDRAATSETGDTGVAKVWEVSRVQRRNGRGTRFLACSLRQVS